jgi:S-adenosylmethionine:tRNA ribosyltransferase-isomerase
LTKGLLNKIKKKGVRVLEVTLHVGLGTFAPVKTEKITDHQIHREFIEVSRSTISAIKRAKQDGRRIISLGTTSCRVLESLDWDKILKAPKIAAQSFWTDIFIYPGYKFKVVDALITNFHLPKSSLLMLVSALAGPIRIKLAYGEAIKRRYRFFSYGDAMFIY